MCKNRTLTKAFNIPFNQHDETLYHPQFVDNTYKPLITNLVFSIKN